MAVRAELLPVTDRSGCPPAVLAAVPAGIRDGFVARNGHLKTAVRRRDTSSVWGAPLPGERDEVRAGWIALRHMVSRGLPLGPLAEVPARYVSRSKIHHRDCYLLRSPVVQTAALGDIARRPCCSVCDGPGFALTDDHLGCLWAVMAIDDITDPVAGLLRRARRISGPATPGEWRQERGDELAACEHIITAVTGLAAVDPRVTSLTGDAILRTQYQREPRRARPPAGAAATFDRSALITTALRRLGDLFRVHSGAAAGRPSPDPPPSRPPHSAQNRRRRATTWPRISASSPDIGA
jgi:hypothetical protein